MGCVESKPLVSKKHALAENMVTENMSDQDFWERYDIVQSVGKGSISSISKVKRKDSFDNNNKEYALKEIEPIYVKEIHNEIELLKRLDHPNVIKAYETYELEKDDKKSIAIILELCTGGDLSSRGPYTERETAMIVGKLCSALTYMHKHYVIHRDIKIENLMFESEEPNAEVKVIDFGLSTRYHPRDELRDRVGTSYTMAPEVIEGNYTSKADMWSVGVVTYELLSGEKPFWATSVKGVMEKIREAEYSFDKPAFKHVSLEAKHFVSSLLKEDPDLRYSADLALKSPWLKKNFHISDRKADQNTMKAIARQLSKYQSGEFKKLALQVIARKSSTEEILTLRKAFDEFDENNDGIITYKEFQTAVAKTGNYSKEEIDSMFRSVDVDGTGTVEYTEFLAATLEAHGRVEEQRVAEAFSVFDEDGNGYITREEMHKILGDEADAPYIDGLIKEVDTNRDGMIDLPEFMNAFRDGSRQPIMAT